MPFSKFLGLPWPAWGETDAMLAVALDTLDSMSCPCGCGQWVDECLSAATDGRWQVEVEDCFARAAIEEFRETHKDDLKPSVLMRARLLAPGDVPADPFKTDGADTYEALRAKFGLAPPDSLDNQGDDGHEAEQHQENEQKHQEV